MFKSNKPTQETLDLMAHILINEVNIVNPDIKEKVALNKIQDANKQLIEEMQQFLKNLDKIEVYND